ncbi:transcriptional regulator [Actinomadura macrotermitis]|uniref:Uncharacterized protein n=1 Tax=Actinomadura macrotermitis TaxID=2585200 RepID=A0A7K0BZN2_9ACTN|nr:transcriptional regulator [Actinomadura macrotermitis]MQY06643.1 hypothetical protein [Actinomadura macrotermitis]
MRSWLEVRDALKSDPDGFGRLADGLYPDTPRVAGTSLLTCPAWVPDAPVPLDGLRLDWDQDAAPPAVADPPDGLPEGFATYAEAIAALDPPAIFDDRPAYRLLHADLRAGTLRFGPGRYFDAVNVGQAAAHELAAGGHALRARIGDPLDLARRPALLAISTLTVTASGSYVLHWRDPAKVAHAGGLHQVMPVGLFQPPAPLDLWANMTREFGEELLGRPEGEDAALHTRLSEARAQGRIRVYCLGLGVDPLTFATDLLTVAVLTDDSPLDGLVAVNDEGTVSRRPFDGTLPAPLQPAGAATLRLAWRHRAALGITPAPAPSARPARR